MADSCTKTYTGVDAAHRELLMSELAKTGATTTGSNPYDVDTHKSGVKLHAVYDEGAQTLTVTITDKPFIASCGMVWDKVDPAVQTALSTPIVKNAGKDPDAAGALGKIGASSGSMSDTDRASFKASLDGLGDLKVAKGGLINSKAALSAAAASSSPTASAGGSGALAWIVAHPAVAIAAVLALGVGGYFIVKKG